MFLILCTVQISAQEVEFSGGVEVMGILGSQEGLPFWFYTETNTATGTFSNASTVVFAKATYSLSENAQLETGMSAFFRDEVPTPFQRNNLYASFKNNAIKITAGARKQNEEAYGLSMTNKNVIWNNNARAIPGILIEANNPLKISNVFSVDWGIGNYFLNDTRYVSNVMVHYKRLSISAKINEKNKITARLQHVAQWGGTSPDFGKLPQDFSAFVSVFFAKKTTAPGENINALGNHIGSILVDYEFETKIGDFSMYYDHLFEDGSGTRYANFPDGLWGVIYTPKNKNIIMHLLYEFATTLDQSGTTGVSGFDNYFSNNLYRSGWTYEQTIIGLPFILVDKNLEITNLTSPIVSNRVQVHHIGINGMYKALNWKVKSTFATHYGTYRQPFATPQKVWSNALWIQYEFKKYGKALFQTGFDATGSTTVFGLGIGYRYEF